MQIPAIKDCKLKILDEPLENISLRYMSEGSGSIVYSNKVKKIGPTVEITNYHKISQKTFIQCSLSTTEEDVDIRGPHFHKLTRKVKDYTRNPPYYEEQSELIISEVKETPNGQFIARFDHLKITRTKENDYLSSYHQKLSYTYKRPLCTAEVQTKVNAINSNEMCLKFEAFIQNEETKEKNDICKPVFSRIIKNVDKNQSKNPLNKKKRKKLKLNSNGVEPTVSGPSKQHQGIDMSSFHRNNKFKESIKSNYHKAVSRPSQENPNKKIILQQSASSTSGEFSKHEFTKIQGLEYGILTNRVAHAPTEISHGNSGNKPNSDSSSIHPHSESEVTTGWIPIEGDDELEDPFGLSDDGKNDLFSAVEEMVKVIDFSTLFGNSSFGVNSFRGGRTKTYLELLKIFLIAVLALFLSSLLNIILFSEDGDG